jgi:hypothetical protein
MQTPRLEEENENLLDLCVYVCVNDCVRVCGCHTNRHSFIFFPNYSILLYHTVRVGWLLRWRSSYSFLVPGW